MFPYSLGVQAPTKERAESDLAAQIEKLSDQHPDEVEKYGQHLRAVQVAAATLIDLLPEDDESSDVAVSAAGHLITKKNEADGRDVQSAQFTVFAGRAPTDPSKHAKPEKARPIDRAKPDKKG